MPRLVPMSVMTRPWAAAVVAFVGCLFVGTVDAFSPSIYPTTRCLLPHQPQSNQRLSPVVSIACGATRWTLETRRPVVLSASLNEYDDTNMVKADDLEALQALFTKYCDAEGLITKQSFMEIPLIADLLNSGDLLLSEFTEIFDRAPTFPEAIVATEASFDALSVSGSSASNGDDRRRSNRSSRRASSSSLNTNHVIVDGNELQQRIDVDSFVQIYRDIDDLFESDDVDTSSVMQSGPAFISDSKAIPSINPNAVFIDAPTESSINGETDESIAAELKAIFATLADETGLVSKEQLLAWDEVVKLLAEGLLGDDELDTMWKETATDKGKLNEDGFLRFNVALDNLFVFDDDEMDDIIVPPSEYETESARMDATLQVPTPAATNVVPAVNDATVDTLSAAAIVDAPRPVVDAVVKAVTAPAASLPIAARMIDGSDLEPDALFGALANADGLVGLDELKLWGELQDILADGDLLESELLSLYQTAPKSERDLTKLEQEGFVALYDAIDNLFEDDDEEDEEEEDTQVSGTTFTGVSRKDELLDAIADLNSENVLPCGLEATELEQREILSIVAQLEDESTNLIRSKQGAIAPTELSGTWELLYSSSSAMKFNKGLSGLGGSVPNGRFGNLQQTLVVTKQLTDVEYIERIEMTPASASFDVKVTGTWDLRMSVSLFTGEPSIVMNVVPDRVTYGPTSTRADHWKSLGPFNMLDITYLDEDLRVMRGNTSVDTIFVFRRTK